MNYNITALIRHSKTMCNEKKVKQNNMQSVQTLNLWGY